MAPHSEQIKASNVKFKKSIKFSAKSSSSYTSESIDISEENITLRDNNKEIEHLKM